MELKSTIKLRVWWQGTVIWDKTGGFKMPKQEKDDGKDSKGKRKDQDKPKSKK